MRDRAPSSSAEETRMRIASAVASPSPPERSSRSSIVRFKVIWEATHLGTSPPQCIHIVVEELQLTRLA